jgi:hypothetical protein
MEKVRSQETGVRSQEAEKQGLGARGWVRGRRIQEPGFRSQEPEEQRLGAGCEEEGFRSQDSGVGRTAPRGGGERNAE